MKICILSGPYNPEKCGISDYIELLISEFTRSGIKCIHITIDEKKLFTHIANNLPDADFYSVQFAPYFFSPAGLSGKPLLKLAKSLSNYKLHINFHEIWIGAYPKSRWKENIIGWFQKKEIKTFIKASNPKVITCSNSAALDRLQNENIKAHFLYLYGTIPFSPCENQVISEHLRVAFLGTLYEKFPYDLLGQFLKNISISLKKDIFVDVIGRQRESEGLKKMQRTFKIFGFDTNVTGNLSRVQISRKIQNCNIGVSTSPYDIIGKSSATATLLEHRLPVIAYDDGDTPIEKLFVKKEFESQIFLLNNKSFLDRLIQSIRNPKKPHFDGVAYTAKEMIGLLN